MFSHKWHGSYFQEMLFIVRTFGDKGHGSHVSLKWYVFGFGDVSSAIRLTGPTAVPFRKRWGVWHCNAGHVRATK